MPSRIAMDVVERYLTKGAGKVIRDTRGIAAAKRQAVGAGTDLVGTLKGVGGALAALGLVEAGRRVLMVGGQFEQFRAQVGGAFGDLQKFASQTPFQLEEVTRSFVLLRNLGIEPTERRLMAFGNIAAGNVGKSLEQFAEAVADASVNEFERLKEFGIKARQEGDKVTFTFRGISKTVQKESAAIVGYLTDIGEVEFAGEMDKKAQTLLGRLSTLTDSFDQLADAVFRFGAGQGAKGAVEFLIDMTNNARDFVDEMGSIQRVLLQMHAAANTAFAGIHGAGNKAFVALGRAVVDWAETTLRAWRPVVEFMERLTPGQTLMDGWENAARMVARLSSRLDDSEAGAAKAIKSYKEAAKTSFAMAISLGKSVKALSETAAITPEAAAKLHELADVIEGLGPIDPRKGAPELLQRIKLDAEDADEALRRLQDALEGISPLDPRKGVPASIAVPGASDIVNATDLLKEGTIEAALSFGQTLAQTLAQGGDTRQAMQSLVADMAVAAGAAIGNALGAGGQAGAAIGGIIGTLLGGLFKRGADEASAQLNVVGNQLVAIAEFIEGNLSPALESMARTIQTTVAVILAEFGGQLEAGKFGFKIREGEVVRVFYMGLQAEFENQAEAASFLVGQILANAVISGLGPSVQEALKHANITSAEALLDVMRFAQGIDRALMPATERWFDVLNSETRVFLTQAAEFGISMDRAVAARAAEIQALIEMDRQAVLVASGLQGGIIAQFRELREIAARSGPEAIARLEAELLAAAEQARNAAAAYADFENEFATFDQLWDQLGGRFRAAGKTFAEMQARWDELRNQGLSTSEVLEQLAVDLQGIDLATLQRAAQVLRMQFVGGLMSDLAGLLQRVGRHEQASQLRARAEEFEIRTRLLAIRTTIQQAHAEGLLSAERVRFFNEFIRQVQQGLNHLIRTGALGGGGTVAGLGTDDSGGGITGGINEQAEALELYRRVMQETTDVLLGITAEERRRLDLEAELRGAHEAGHLSLEQLNEALANLAAVADLATETMSRGERRLERIGEKENFLQIGRNLAQIAGNQQAIARFEREIKRLQIERYILLAEAEVAAGRMSERRLEVFRNLADQALAQLEMQTFDSIGAIQSLARSMEGLGLSLPEDVTEALAMMEFELARARALETIATLQAAAAAGTLSSALQGIDWQSIVDQIMNLDFSGGGGGGGGSLGAPPAADPRLWTLGGGRPIGMAGRRSNLEAVLARLDNMLRQQELSQMDPFQRQLAEITDRWTELIEDLRAEGATRQDILRAERGRERALALAHQQQQELIQGILQGLQDQVDAIRGPQGTVAGFNMSRAAFERARAAFLADPSEANARAVQAAGAAFLQQAQAFGHGPLTDALAAVEGFLANQQGDKDSKRNVGDLIDGVKDGSMIFRIRHEDDVIQRQREATDAMIAETRQAQRAIQDQRESNDRLVIAVQAQTAAITEFMSDAIQFN